MLYFYFYKFYFILDLKSNFQYLINKKYNSYNLKTAYSKTKK